MCGRYYVDDDTAREIEKLVRQVDEKMRRGIRPAGWRWQRGTSIPRMPPPSWQRRAPGLPVFGSAGASPALRKARSSSMPDASPPWKSQCSVRASCTVGLSYRQPASMNGTMTGGSISFTETVSLSCIWQDVTGSMGTGTGL